MGHRPSHTDDFALSPHGIPGTGGYTFTPAEYEKAAVNETVRSLSQELAVAARAGVTPVRVGAAGSMEGLAQLANLGPQSANGVEISHAVLSGGRLVLRCRTSRNRRRRR